MEDRHLVQTASGGGAGGSPCADRNSALLAVFDGHRGPQAAEYAKCNFLRHLLDQAAASDAEAALRAAFVSTDEAFRKEHSTIVTEGVQEDSVNAVV